MVFNPWSFIAQGTTAQSRIGNEVYPRGMAIRMHYVPSEDRMTQHLRVIICTLPKASAGIVNTGSNFNLFDTTGTAPNNILLNFRKDDTGIRIMFDKVYALKSVPFGSTTTGVNRFFKKLYIKRKRASKIIWEANQQIINKPLCVFVIPYDRYVATRTDILGRLDLFYKLYWRDV